MLTLKVNNTNEELDLTLEASAEREKVKAFMNDNLGKDYFDKYLKIRDRLTDMNLKDFNKIIKLDPEDVKVAIDRYYTSGDSSNSNANSGKRKVGENEDWIVYHVTTFPAAQELGEGTEWCITGRYGNMDPDDDHYFNNYIRDNNLDGGYYFYIPKDGSNNKYCLLLTKNGQIHSLWKTPNGQVYDIGGLNFPEVRGINLDEFEVDLEERLQQAYDNDDPEEWRLVGDRMADADMDPYFPTLEECIRDEKPNIFQFLINEWRWLDGKNINDLFIEIYNELPQYQRGDFLSALNDDYDKGFEPYEIIESIDEDDAKSDFFLEYLNWFDLDGLVRSIGIDTFEEWSNESWFNSNEVLSTLIENNGGSLSEIFDNLDFDNWSYEDGLKLLTILEKGGYEVDSKLEEEYLNLYKVIDQILDEVEDGGADENSEDYVDVIVKMGSTLDKDDASRLMERIEEMDDSDKEGIPEGVLKVIKKAL